ncbi:MAG: HAD family phosphatase, partial [Ginsengibacter sp.]
FDLNGTMINDMPYHIKAWHRIVTHLGSTLSMEQVKQECYGKNEEVLERIFPGRFAEGEKTGIGLEKEKQYRVEFKPHLKLIKGLDDLLKKTCERGIKMAIGSAAIPSNIDFVLDGLQIRKYFDAIVSADEVTYSKPHQETFVKCAARLSIDCKDCLVFEDAPKGVEAAQNAGMDCVVINSLHLPEEFEKYKNVVLFTTDFEEIEI